MYFTGVVHFANRHACMTFEHIVAPRQEIQSLTAHTNPPVLEVWRWGSRVYVCARHQHRDVEEMDEMCDKNSIFACFDAMITQKSHDHPGYRSWFHFSFDRDVAHAFWKHGKQWRWQHVQPLRVYAIQNTRATIVVQSQQHAVKLTWRYKLILNWYVGAWIYIRRYDIKKGVRRHLGIGVWIHIITCPAGSWLYVSIHQSPSLCNAIQMTGQMPSRYNNYAHRLCFIVFYCVLLCFVVFCCVLLCFIVFCCVLLCFVVFCCVLLCFVVFCCVLLCFIVFCCVLLCFIVFYCVLLCFVVFCCVLLCFIVFCCVLLCFIVFCCVLLCFVVFCCVLLCFVVFCCVLLCFVVFCCVLLCFIVFCCVLLCFVVFCCRHVLVISFYHIFHNMVMVDILYVLKNNMKILSPPSNEYSAITITLLSICGHCLLLSRFQLHSCCNSLKWHCLIIKLFSFNE